MHKYTHTKLSSLLKCSSAEAKAGPYTEGSPSTVGIGCLIVTGFSGSSSLVSGLGFEGALTTAPGHYPSKYFFLDLTNKINQMRCDVCVCVCVCLELQKLHPLRCSSPLVAMGPHFNRRGRRQKETTDKWL